MVSVHIEQRRGVRTRPGSARPVFEIHGAPAPSKGSTTVSSRHLRLIRPDDVISRGAPGGRPVVGVVGIVGIVGVGAPSRRLERRPVEAGCRPGPSPTERTFRRRRAVAVTGLVLVLAGLWLALQAAVGGSGGGLLTASVATGGTPVAAHMWVVRPGDTLWGIALATGAHGDIRPVVDSLEAQLGGRPLIAGERIVVP